MPLSKLHHRLFPARCQGSTKSKVCISTGSPRCTVANETAACGKSNYCVFGACIPKLLDGAQCGRSGRKMRQQTPFTGMDPLRAGNSRASASSLPPAMTATFMVTWP
jgi:hypothetical protein